MDSIQVETDTYMTDGVLSPKQLALYTQSSVLSPQYYV